MTLHSGKNKSFSYYKMPYVGHFNLWFYQQEACIWLLSLNAENWILTQDIDEPFVSLQIVLSALPFNMSNLLIKDSSFWWGGGIFLLKGLQSVILTPTDRADFNTIIIFLNSKIISLLFWFLSRLGIKYIYAKLYGFKLLFLYNKSHFFTHGF